MVRGDKGNLGAKILYNYAVLDCLVLDNNCADQCRQGNGFSSTRTTTRVVRHVFAPKVKYESINVR